MYFFCLIKVKMCRLILSSFWVFSVIKDYYYHNNNDIINKYFRILNYKRSVWYWFSKLLAFGSKITHWIFLIFQGQFDELDTVINWSIIYLIWTAETIRLYRWKRLLNHIDWFNVRNKWRERIDLNFRAASLFRGLCRRWRFI
jgi:hypothetical protein